MSATSPDQHEVRRLIDLMKDPRYWRDNDPSVLSDVRSGFKSLYGKPDPRRPRDSQAAAETALRRLQAAARASVGH